MPDINPENDKYSLVNFALNDNPSGFQDALDQKIKDVIADKLADQKIQMQQSVLDVGYDKVPEDAEPDHSDNDSTIDPEDDIAVDDQLSDDEINDLSDEEWDQIIKQIEDDVGDDEDGEDE